MLQKKLSSYQKARIFSVPETAEFWNFWGVLMTLSFEPLNWADRDFIAET